MNSTKGKLMLFCLIILFTLSFSNCSAENYDCRWVGEDDVTDAKCSALFLNV